MLQGASWDAPTFNLSDLLIKLRKYDDGIIYSVVTATNQENSSVYDIEVRTIGRLRKNREFSFSLDKELLVYKNENIIIMKLILPKLTDNLCTI